jgi:ribosomal protein S18 acetylase RimI-like enzyme
MRIRRATYEDAAAVAAVHVASWEGAYRGLVPDDVMDPRTVEERTRFWRGQLAAPPPRTRVLVAEIDGAVAGFVDVGPATDDDVDDPDRTGLIHALYVDPAFAGGGVGRALLEAGERDLAERWFLGAVLAVLTGNARARRFYEAAGYRALGPQRPSRWAGGAPELRYVKRL